MACVYVSTNGERSWKDLFPYVTPHIRRVPPEVLANALRLATIEFCQKTGILRHRVAVDLQAGVADYPLCAPAGYQILRVGTVQVGSQCVSPAQTWRCVCGYTFRMETPDYLVLKTPPGVDTVAGMTVELVLAPHQDSLVLDELLYQQWAEAIASGAMARLFLVPDVPWFNTVLAAKYDRDWRVFRSRARAVLEKGHTERALMMTAKRWV